MKFLLENWKNFLIEKKDISGGRKLPLDVLDLLIKHYAKNPGGFITLKRGYFDFNDFRDKDLENDVAVYIAAAQMILININKAQDKFGSIVRVMLHEIQHYNQHMRWNVDDQYREKLSQGYKLPPGKDIFELDWIPTINFWEKIYPHEQRPHEVDAIKFAEEHVQEAAKMIKDREKELKK